jgi:hypothetical protein
LPFERRKEMLLAESSTREREREREGREGVACDADMVNTSA